jgi:hypothetical protein
MMMTILTVNHEKPTMMMIKSVMLYVYFFLFTFPFFFKYTSSPELSPFSFNQLMIRFFALNLMCFLQYLTAVDNHCFFDCFFMQFASI